MNKFRSIAVVWAFVVTFALIVIKGTSIGPVVYVVNKSLGMGIHSFDFVVAIPFVFALEFTVRKLRKIGESELSKNVEPEPIKVFVNSYSSGTEEFVNVETIPMKIIAE